MVSRALYTRFYGAPGDPKYDGTHRFFSMVRQQMRRSDRVLNLGAGAGTKDPRCVRKGEADEVIGADIDPAVLTNDEVDRGVHIQGDQLPFPNESFDLVFSDFVIEHVERPSTFLGEVYRVLRRGGSYCFRTPNIFHYVTLASRLTPHWVHRRWANSMRGLPEGTHEPWPTYYRLNTRTQIRKAARQAGFGSIELHMVEGHPAYLMSHGLPFCIGVAYERLLNSNEVFAGLRSNILGRLGK